MAMSPLISSGMVNDVVVRSPIYVVATTWYSPSDKSVRNARKERNVSSILERS